MSEETETVDEKQETMMRIARFAGFFIVLMFIWYGFGLSEVV